MADLTRLRDRVRLELGDRSTKFRDTFRGSGDVAEYQLSHINISTATLRVTSIGQVTDDLVLGTDFDLDPEEGNLVFPAPVEEGTVILVEGESYGILSDDEVDIFLREATMQHTNGTTTTQRYRDPENGYIRYHTVPVTLANLPEVEEYLVVLLTCVQALWALSTDAATDIDVQAPDGTSISRGQRYAQLLKQIDVLTDKYNQLCQQYNVGLNRIEMSNLRRVSRTTGRLVPLFEEREYDDHALPSRMLPEIDSDDVDVSGIPSSAFYGIGGSY